MVDLIHSSFTSGDLRSYLTDTAGDERSLVVSLVAAIAAL